MNLMELAIKVAVQDGEAQKKLTRLSKAAGKGLASAAKIGIAAVGAAVTAVGAFTAKVVSAYGEYEQLVGGAKKIFDQMDYGKIAADAQNAYMTMNLSASQYLSMINSVGATFAATMGDEKGYDTAVTGMQAIADYASGTGRNVDELSQKFALITRSTSSYQSIEDQFSGILPATSKDFLEQAQAVGLLEGSYKSLTEVPIAEYQQAISKMLEKGVDDLGLAQNTYNETLNTITGSLAGLKASWQNLLTGLGDADADLDKLYDNVVNMAIAAANNIKPIVSRTLKGVSTIVSKLAPTIGEELPGLLGDILPDLISAAEGLLGGLADALPDLLLTLLDNLPQLVSSVVTIAGKIFDGLKTAIPELLGGIWERIDTALSESGVGQAWNTLKQNVSGVVDDLKQKWEDLKTAAEPLAKAIGKIKDKFVEWVTSPEFQASVFSKITTAIDDVGTAVGLVMDGITFILDNAQAAWDALGGGASTAAKAILSAFSPVTSLFSGLAGKISGLFSGLSIPNFGSIFGSLLGGQYAIGADYIPYNGYPAILHRGEAVLTAREADEWRRGQGKGSGVVNNFTFNGVSQSDLDYIVAYVNRGLA